MEQIAGRMRLERHPIRVSRYAVVMRNEDRQSKPIMKALTSGLAPLPADARQSTTFDRGIGFAGWRRLRKETGADAWFCDPQTPCRGRMRRVPGSGDWQPPRPTGSPDHISAHRVGRIGRFINNSPEFPALARIRIQPPNQKFRLARKLA